MNRLADSQSPYLRQHATNPVDWFPWGEAAFAAARERDVPILLSVGYSSCHWCHVMAHESFEDPATAALINEHFVSVKVDREERPDVDAVYMEATQAITGQGGWPMTVFMTAEGHPFFCGTYFPRPAFERLLEAVARTWRDDRERLVGEGQRIVTALAGRGTLPNGPAPSAELLEVACRSLRRGFDERAGGFGGAPKFPPSMVCEFLLRRTGDDDAYAMAATTLEAMARGGIYDQIGGGFARYSVDAAWVVPHFEKMLYDNALLARVYAHWWRSAEARGLAADAALARRVALETCAWILRDLRTAEGGLASALDADSGGVEGAFYVWTPDQFAETLGAEDGEWASGVFGVTPEGTFEHGASVLQRRTEPADDARLASVRDRLLAVRADRVAPGRDDKVVAAWNGLAVAALAECGVIFERPELLAAARTVAELIERVHVRGDRLVRTSRDGVAGENAGVLEDYADLAEGLVALFGATGEARYVRLTADLLDVVLDRFGDGAGGFFDTADDAERLFDRPRDPTDNATPSGQFAAAGALLSHAALTGSARHLDAARAALGPVDVLGERHARFAGWGLAVAEAVLAGPAEVAIVGDGSDARTVALLRTAFAVPAPGAVVAPGSPGEIPAVELLAGRGLLAGAPAAYVCRKFACRVPVGDPDALRRELS
jgi:hypothetical protein